MNRLTKDDVNEIGMLELSHNQVFVRNHEAWYRDYDMEMTARDLARAMFARNGIECPADEGEFDEYMLELLQDGYETIDGMIAHYYNALWSMAEVRERLKAYEDTKLKPVEITQLNDAFKNSQKKLEKAFDDLLAYKDLEEQGLLIKLPCKVGDTVYYVNLSNKVINYTVSGFKVDCFGNLQINVARHLESGYFLDMQLGKTVFLTREEAEKALEEDQ